MTRTIHAWLSWVCALVLILGVTLSGTAAEPARKQNADRKAAAKKQHAELVARLTKLESSLSAQPQTTASGSGRYQLQTVGEQLVVLDTQTGETRVVDLTPPTPIQAVEVGNAWVVVTVLGNVSTPRLPTAAPATPPVKPATPPVKKSSVKK